MLLIKLMKEKGFKMALRMGLCKDNNEIVIRYFYWRLSNISGETICQDF